MPLLIKECFLLCFLVCVSLSRAGAQDVSWAFGAGASGSDQGYDISSDTLGHVYVTGWFSGTMDLGGQMLVSQGMQDIFIASFDSDGNLNWVRQAGGTGNDVSAGIVTAGNGDSYITGWYAGTGIFGDSTVVSNGSLDMFVAKYDASGTLQWVRSGGGSADDYGNRVTVTHDGGVAVAGSFKQTFLADGQQMTSNGNRDALFCRYAPDGELLWMKGVGGIGEDRAYGITQDADNDLVVTGLFSDAVQFGASSLSCSSFFGTYVAKLSEQGDPLWAVKGDGGANDFARGFGVMTDPQGDIVINGFFSGLLRIGGFTLAATGGQYDQDSYLVKLDGDGQVLWAKHAGGSGTDQGTDLHATAQGDIVEIGFFHDVAQFAGQSITASGLSDVYVVKYDGNGNVLWASGYGGSGNEYAYGVTEDAEGNIYLTGVFTGTGSLGAFPLVPAGGNDIFVAKIASPSSAVSGTVASAPISLYPNPAHDGFWLDLQALRDIGAGLELVITDMTGTPVLRRKDIGPMTYVDVSTLPRGAYAVAISGSGSTSVTRLIIH